LGEIKSPRRTVWICVFVLLTLLWMSLIYWFSSSNGTESGAFSEKILRKILSYAVSGWDRKSSRAQMQYIDKLHHLFRKLGHFSEYLILGVFIQTTLMLLVSVRSAGNKITHGALLRTTLFSGALCFLYACSDEFHQRFVAGRSGEFRDVMIDFSGAVLGVLIILLISLRIQRKKSGAAVISKEQ